MNEQVETNRKLWNELTEAHLKGSEVYPIEDFKNGKNILNDIEIEEVGNVKNKKLLHLQCHFGMDTLCGARLGAKVTGVDMSDNAILAARKLAKEVNIPATFIRENVLNFSGKINEKFDIVFASYGALYWISDIKKWCKVASSYLNKNGFLYIVDGHPFYHWLNRDETETDLSKYEYSYFDRTAQKYENATDYADESFISEMTEYGWHFTVGDLINASIEAGLNINFFNEFPSFKIKKYGNAWRPIGENVNFPVMFSMKATKNEY